MVTSVFVRAAEFTNCSAYPMHSVKIGRSLDAGFASINAGKQSKGVSITFVDKERRPLFQRLRQRKQEVG